MCVRESSCRSVAISLSLSLAPSNYFYRVESERETSAVSVACVLSLHKESRTAWATFACTLSPRSKGEEATQMRRTIDRRSFVPVHACVCLSVSAKSRGSTVFAEEKGRERERERKQTYPQGPPCHAFSFASCRRASRSKARDSEIRWHLQQHLTQRSLSLALTDAPLGS